MVPMVRDLRFAWEEMPQQLLDEQQQKVRDSLHAALSAGRAQAGEGSDYTDNLPAQCLHPVGHWFEVPNLLRNGVLAQLLHERPQLKYLLLHNIDTLGADVDPALLGLHIAGGRVSDLRGHHPPHGRPRRRPGARERPACGWSKAWPCRARRMSPTSLLQLQHCWIDIDQLLAVFGLTRADLGDAEVVAAAVRALAARMPTYITLKDVKKRWGHGQEDVFPVSQFEKLWGDMTALPEVEDITWSSPACAASSSRTRPNSTAGCATAPPRM